MLLSEVSMKKPSDWQVKRIDELGKVQAGRQRSPHFQDGVLRPYLRVANIFDGYIDTSDVLHMFFTDDEFDRYRLEPGDILLNEGQSLELVGRCAMYKGFPEDCCFQNTLVRFRANGSVDPAYMLSLFRNLQQMGRFEIIASQTTSIAHLGVSRFAGMKVLVPSLSEQRAIDNVLAVWDRAIGQTERLIAAKRRRKRALTQQLLTGKRRFREFVKSPAVRDTKFGPVPMDWQYFKVGDFASEVSERNADGADLSVLSCSKYDGLVESLKYFGKRVFSEDTTNYKVVRRNQFAYPCNHVEEGSIGILDFLDAGIVSPIYAVFQTAASVHVPFLYALFKTELYRHIFEISTSASVDRRGSLRWSQFAQIRVALPTLEEQKKIAECLACCDRAIGGLCEKLDLLKEQKNGLMQQLLTGKTRVNTQ